MQSKPSNPFNSKLAIENSNYAAFQNEQLVLLGDQNKQPSAQFKFVHGQFRAMIQNPHFPCIGAKSAFQGNSYRCGMYPPMASQEATAGLSRDLFTFISEQDEMDSEFTTFVASFDGPNPKSENHFEQILWEQLQLLHNEDVVPWDPKFSNRPEDPDFSFSFGGRGFFILGLHPGSSRWARRFAWPTLVFNAHFQFHRLMDKGSFDTFKKVIRKRDIVLQGGINPSLVDFEARQYSGRYTEDEWKCPFHQKELVD